VIAYKILPQPQTSRGAGPVRPSATTRCHARATAFDWNEQFACALRSPAALRPAELHRANGRHRHSREYFQSAEFCRAAEFACYHAGAGS